MSRRCGSPPAMRNSEAAGMEPRRPIVRHSTRSLDQLLRKVEKLIQLCQDSFSIPAGCMAAAHDGRKTVSMVRCEGENLAQLLTRRLKKLINKSKQ